MKNIPQQTHTHEKQKQRFFGGQGLDKQKTTTLKGMHKSTIGSEAFMSGDSWMYPGPTVPLWEFPRKKNK